MRSLSIVLLFIFVNSSIVFCRTIELVTTEFPPYVYTEDDRIKGFNVDLLNEIFERMGADINITIMPWARAVVLIEQGDADAIFPFLKTRERAVYTNYTDPFTEEDTALFVLRDSVIQWSGDLKDLAGYRFGRVRGYSSGPKIDKLIQKGIITIDETDRSVNNIRKLLSGRFDILIEARYTALHGYTKMGKSDQIRMLAVIQKNPSHLGFSKKRKQLTTIIKFNSILKKMKKDGTYQHIVDNFFNIKSL